MVNVSDEDLRSLNGKTTLFQKWKAALQDNGKVLGREI